MLVQGSRFVRLVAMVAGSISVACTLTFADGTIAASEPPGIRLPFVGSATWSITASTHTGSSANALDFFRPTTGRDAWDGRARAADGGVVIYRGTQVGEKDCPVDSTKKLGYGRLVILYHPETGLATYYAHLASFADGVSLDSKVTKGQELGVMGDSGCADGKHLHFEVRSGGGDAPFQGASVPLDEVPGMRSDGTASGPGVWRWQTFKVDSWTRWMDTGIELEPGPVRITAKGTVDTGVFEYEWPADGCASDVPCWSLIGRLDGGPRFPVGSRFDRQVKGGKLQLGIADEDFLFDNSGSWQVRVRVRNGPVRALDVSATRAWTATGITIPPGARLRVRAYGAVLVDESSDIRMLPGGCIAYADSPSGAWLAPGLHCWSLIGRVGAEGVPFEVGSSFAKALPRGRLYLAPNDVRFDDNEGSWTVTVRSLHP
jgi:hypothetical protein